ncbi:MAG: lipid biosynthesis acyltransferase [Bacteroidetes bacterium]|nr:lipid biosynthesis acyltransferase [Bacteroidota bacterium]
MGTVGFYIFYGVNWVITLLPLKILYIFSDILFLLLYYFPSYRRKVVDENLRNSFPEKSVKEIALIGKKFYRHLADIFIETLKLTHLSNKELIKRLTVSNPEFLNTLYNSGRDLVVVGSHYNNWEWLIVCLPLYTKYKCIGVYKPLRNKLFEKFINSIRLRNDQGLAPMNLIVRNIIDNQRKNIRALYAFAADQTPAKAEIRYYTTFLNQETPVFLGIEKIASKYDMAVVFFNFQKIRRGYYNLTVELLFERAAGLPEYKVTETHVKRLEELIREKPEYWIWTHRRWKYKKPAIND